MVWQIGYLAGDRETNILLLTFLLSRSVIFGEVASQVCASAPPPPFAYLIDAVSKLAGVKTGS